MRIILFPNGSIVENNIDLDLTPGHITTDIVVPGFIPDTLELSTDLGYDTSIANDVITIDIFVPEDYGASGPSSILVSYATTDISGVLVYQYDVGSGHVSRGVFIANNSGQSFSSEIAVAEDQDIYGALGSDQILYGIVGTLDVRQGSHFYNLPASINVSVIYNVFPSTRNTNISLEIDVGGNDPLPGSMTLSFPGESFSFDLTSRYAQVAIPEKIILLSNISSNQYSVQSAVTGPIRIVDTTLSAVDKDGVPISFSYEDGAIFDATPGTYILTK